MRRPDPVDAAIAGARAVAVIRARRVPDAAALAEVLSGAGLPVLELTFTIPEVLDLVRSASRVGTATVGVGTVLDADQARAAVDAGAQFLVAPTMSHDVLDVAREHGVPYLPGASTPTEIQAAHLAGASMVKVFPARIWGPQGLRDVATVLGHVRLLPAGGVSAANAADYLAAGAHALFAGSSVVPAAAVEDGDLDEISRRATEFTSALAGPG